MPHDSRVTTNDWNLVQRAGAGVAVGKAFAFIFPSAFAHPDLAWVRALGADAAPRVVPLLGPEPASLPGATVRPLDLAPLSLACVTSDKEIYREGRDVVRLLALDPLSPGRDASLAVSLDGVELERRRVRLDAAGAAAVELRDLPAGAYEAAFADAPDGVPPAEFTVAEYRLAPLVASLADRRVEGAPPKLRARVRLETYGTPVDGGVRVELAERGRPRDYVMATARGGELEASFALDGEGPFSLNLMLEADPSRTATVPIPGSRAAERSLTTFSTIGAEVLGSLLPSEGSTPVRGVFLEEGARRATPFRLDRVDTRRARLVAAATAGPVAVAVLDATAPAPRPGAVDPFREPHPATDDEGYRRGEALFAEGRYAEALEAFARARAGRERPHPFYAYYAACCRARLGDREAAVADLRAAIADGWRDIGHLATDDDLAALRGFAPYESLARGGRLVLTFERVEAGAVLEIDVPGPTAVVAVGAVVDGAAWEGWAATLAPSALEARVSVPETCAPASEVAVDVEVAGASAAASVYVVVKDARLLAGDTPATSLAARLKAYVGAASSRLAVGEPPSLASIAEPPFIPPPAPSVAYMRAAPDFANMTLAGARPTAAAIPPMVQMTMPSPVDFAPPTGRSATAESAPAAPPKPATGDDPEVVFASLVPVASGRARATARLGTAFADYVVEAIVVDGVEWAEAGARFRAAKDPFASLELPAFVHPEDAAVGRVAVGASGGAFSVRVTRDGADIALAVDGRPLEADEAVRAARADVTFLAGPGDYEVVVRDLATGREDRAARRVDVPGRLRRVARSVRLLEPGERVSRADDPSIVALRVLPSLDGPFEVLVDATADYGHACCEQTAAKMLSACAMYAFAESDEERRRRAGSIVVAGVRRERSMWLRGRGFKMYPESPDTPNDYWGPKAARYLWNLAFIRDGDAPSSELGAAVDEGLRMADDSCRAYAIAWPPAAAASCEEAYAAVRFGADARSREAALVRARAHTPALVAGGAVALRAESAYAAATLLRAGAAADRGRALALANEVVGALGENGRLYSTVDSVAAIALLGELRAAGVAGAAGRVEVDGRATDAADAEARGAGAGEVRALQGVVAVEVSRLVEEDWGAFSSRVAVAVSLEKDGRAARRFTVGDALSLRVRLESGYKDGDLVWVCLPDALSRVLGGGQVKRFSVDFEGRDEVVIPLAATSVTIDRAGGVGAQHFAVCVRNMFEEERAGNPGLLDVTVAPPAAGGGPQSAFARMFDSVRALLGG